MSISQLVGNHQRGIRQICLSVQSGTPHYYSEMKLSRQISYSNNASSNSIIASKIELGIIDMILEERINLPEKKNKVVSKLRIYK